MDDKHIIDKLRKIIADNTDTMSGLADYSAIAENAIELVEQKPIQQASEELNIDDPLSTTVAKIINMVGSPTLYSTPPIQQTEGWEQKFTELVEKIFREVKLDGTRPKFEGYMYMTFCNLIEHVICDFIRAEIEAAEERGFEKGKLSKELFMPKAYPPFSGESFNEYLKRINSY